MALFTKAALLAELNAKLVDNDTGLITPSVHKALLRDIIDSSAAGAGSDILPRLKWHPTSGWTPVSDTETQYLIVTRTDDFNVLRRALVQALTAGGSDVDLPNIPAFVSSRLSSYIVLGGPNTNGNDALIGDMWPAGEAPPFFWLCSPTAQGWLERSRVTVWTTTDNSGAGRLEEDQAVIGRLPYTILINGVPFDCGRYLTQLQRPVDTVAGQAALRFRWRYSEPPAGAHVVEQVL